MTFEEFVAEIGPLLQEKDSEDDVRRVWRLFDGIASEASMSTR